MNKIETVPERRVYRGSELARMLGNIMKGNLSLSGDGIESALRVIRGHFSFVRRSHSSSYCKALCGHAREKNISFTNWSRGCSFDTHWWV